MEGYDQQPMLTDITPETSGAAMQTDQQQERRIQQDHSLDLGAMTTACTVDVVSNDIGQCARSTDYFKYPCTFTDESGVCNAQVGGDACQKFS